MKNLIIISLFALSACTVGTSQKQASKDSVKVVPVAIYERTDTVRYPKAIIYKGANHNVCFEDSGYAIIHGDAVKDSLGRLQYVQTKTGIPIQKFLNAKKDSIPIKQILSY